MPSFPLSPDEVALAVRALDFQADCLDAASDVPGASRTAQELRVLSSVVRSCPPSLSVGALRNLCIALDSLVISGLEPDPAPARSLRARLLSALPADR